MKILQVASGLTGWGGIESHVVNLSDELRRRGHDVTIACQPGKYVEGEANKRNLPTVALVCRKKHDWAAARSFAEVYRREQYDVVHVHGGADHVVPPFVARRCGVPAVLMTRHTPKRLNAVSRYLYGAVCYHHIVAIADYVRGVLIESGIPPGHVTTIHHGTDTALFSPDAVSEPASAFRAKHGIPDDGRPVAGFAGRFVPEKGGDVLVRALKKTPGMVAVFFGDGVKKEEWQSLAAEQGVADRVLWAGFQEQIGNALNAVDIFVLPSVWAEPCAAVVQQAMALEKPVVGTAIGGTPEMIADGDTGMLTPPSDSDALADALSKLALLSARERRAMGERGRERVIARFSLAHMAQEVEALYHRLAAR